MLERRLFTVIFGTPLDQSPNRVSYPCTIYCSETRVFTNPETYIDLALYIVRPFYTLRRFRWRRFRCHDVSSEYLLLFGATPFIRHRYSSRPNWVTTVPFSASKLFDSTIRRLPRDFPSYCFRFFRKSRTAADYETPTTTQRTRIRIY